MKTRSPTLFLCLILLCALMNAGAVAADTADEIIAKARTFLGGEEALNKVKSIRFIGSVELDDGTTGDIELIVQKPVQQRLTLTLGEAREITALNGYDAWRRVESINDPTKWELMLLEPDRIRDLRAQYWENLFFFRGTEAAGGRVEMRGEETVDGIPCVKVAFIHGRNIEFLRFFDKETGRLVLSKSLGGEIIREHGEIFVDEIRFPRELERTGDGPKSTVTFSDISINEKFGKELFEMPLMLPPSRR